MSLIADIFITTKGREKLLLDSLQSFAKNTKEETYRLTLINDSGDEGVSVEDILWNYRDHLPKIDHYIKHNSENLGLGPSINQALSHIETLNQWYSDPLAGDPSKVAPFIVYCQDDLIYTPGWLEKLTKMFLLLEKQHNLGFASGLECVEHAVSRDLGNGMLLKNWIRAAQMCARREYWMSMTPIPRFDPETGRVRAKPNDGMGSGVDWHFIRNHKNSVCQTGKTCLVIPGLVVHAGYKNSTWLKRELPESEKDKRTINDVT